MNSKQQPIQLESAPNQIGTIQKFRNIARDRLMGTITVTIVGSLLLSGASAWNIYNSCRSPVNQQVERDRANGDSPNPQNSLSPQLFNSFIVAGGVLALELICWLLVLSVVRDYIRHCQTLQAAHQQARADLGSVNESLQTELQIRQQQVEAATTERQYSDRDLDELLAVVQKIEFGDLSARARVNDRASGKIGDALNRLVSGLQALISQVSVSARQVAANSGERGDLAVIICQNATEQSQWVNRVSALTETVHESTSAAIMQLQETYQSSANLQTAVIAGERSLDSLDRQVNVFQQSSDRIVQQMKTLGEFVGLADKFVYEQGEIATQTQVLALNASLVAARAAEQRDPKQFETVAREFESIASQVSQLAQQTNEGLNSLEQSNKQIHSVVADVDGEAQRVGGSIDSLTQGVNQTRSVLTTVESIVQRVVSASDAISQLSQTIVASTDSTAQSIATIAALSNQVEHHSQSARLLCAQANELAVEIVSNLDTFTLSAPVTTGIRTVVPIPPAAADRSAVASADYQLN
jgi:methyl-accepting chemotaxis protein PixJ